MRDCLDVISSVYQQSLDYVDPKTDFDQLSNRNMKRWFDYNSEWIENKNQLDILTLNYEDLIESKENIIHSISKFLNIEIDDETNQEKITGVKRPTTGTASILWAVENFEKVLIHGFDFFIDSK